MEYWKDVTSIFEFIKDILAVFFIFMFCRLVQTLFNDKDGIKKIGKSLLPKHPENIAKVVKLKKWRFAFLFN